MQPEKRRARSEIPAAIRKQLESSFQLPHETQQANPPSILAFQPSEKANENEPQDSFPAPRSLTLCESEAGAPTGAIVDEARQIRTLLKSQLGQKTFQHYFEGSTRFRVEADVLIVGVGSLFLATWMQKQFRPVIAEQSRLVLGNSAQVRFEVDEELVGQLSTSVANSKNPDTTEAGSPGKPSARHVAASVDQPSGSSPTPKPRPTNGQAGRRFARLEDFVIGANPPLAVSAVDEVCQHPGEQYNPLYLHGGVGMGKTHLLEGIYRRLRATHPSLRVLYLTAEVFTNYFTEALREKTLPGFRHKFRNVDVLLVDDLDFLQSKRGIQEEFLHTFKEFEGRGGQLVLSADRHPRLLANFSEELISRCLSGLVCRLEAPDQEIRREIARGQAARLKASFPEDVLDFIAKRFSQNVRELQGAVNTLAAYGRASKRRVSLSTARRVLAELERDCTRIVRMADVEQTVCQFFGVSPSDLKSGKRIRSLTQPRMLAMFLIRKHTQAAYQEIGQYFGGRNHATVISAEKKVLGWLSEQTPVKVAADTWPVEDVVEALERMLLAG